MRIGYDIAAWHELFAAEVGAAAALTGLLFVAISINLSRILAADHLAARAGIGVSLLIVVLIDSTLGLVPGITTHWLGAGVLIIAGGGWVWPTTRAVRAGRGEREVAKFIADVVMTQASILPAVVAGITLLAGSGGGLYWLVPAIVFSFGTAALNAWVLLVEIMR